MPANVMLLFIGMALAIVVRRTNYSIPAAFSDIFMMGRYHQLVAVLVSIGAFGLVNIWGYEPCPTWADVGWGGAPGVHSLVGGVLQGAGYMLIAGWPLSTLVRLGGGLKRYMVVAGGFLIGAILFAQVANPVHRVFDPLQIEGFISIKQLFSPKAHRVPIKAHDLTITTIEGKDVTLEDLCGLNQLVVINFWATWCRPCIEEMPALERMHTAYRHNGIAFLGIATQDSAPKVREFVAQHNITYEIAMDKEDQITNAFGGVKTLPTTVFLDNKGNIVKIHKGYLAQRELELHLKNLLPKWVLGLHAQNICDPSSVATIKTLSSLMLPFWLKAQIDGNNGTLTWFRQPEVLRPLHSPFSLSYMSFLTHLRACSLNSST